MNKLLLLLSAFCMAGFVSVNASATVINPVADEWYSFDVDEFVALDAGLGWIDGQLDPDKNYQGDGSALTFIFSLASASILTIVDAGIAGDEFGVLLNGVEYFSSEVNAQNDSYVGTDFEVALADQAFSRISLVLGAGSYTLTGFLSQSAVDTDGFALNATLGGLKITETNEPGMLVLLASLFGLLISRRLGKNQSKGDLV